MVQIMTFRFLRLICSKIALERAPKYFHCQVHNRPVAAPKAFAVESIPPLSFPRRDDLRVVDASGGT